MASPNLTDDIPLWLLIVLVIALAAAILATSSCAGKQHVHQVIPKDCMKVVVTGFRKPCNAISDTLAVCDQVEIHYFCTKYQK